jgi:general secretion pathway protein H
MMRTSRAGKASDIPRVARREGYSLLELLVVIAIFSIMAVMIVGYVPDRRHVREAKLDAYRLEMDLRSARSRAIYGGEAVGFTVDLAQNAWRYGDAPEHKASKGTRLSIYTGRQLLSGVSAGTIRFFPNGQSSGGHITLEAAGLRSEVDVDWMTGRIHQRDLDDQASDSP